MNKKKLLQKIIAGPYNVDFNDFVKLIEAFGFVFSRSNGSHHIYKHPLVAELVNIQNVRGKAKPYQIRQVLSLLEKYHLTLSEEEE